MTQSFVLTGTTSWPVPNGWSNTGAFVEGLGAGGKGSVKSSNTVVGGGGGGGEYRKANLSGLTTGNSITVAVGDGTSATPANTTFNTSTLIAKPGGQGTTTTAGAGGTGGTGAAANANGGAGAKLASTLGSGGGGAGGPSGAGTTATTQAGGAANGGTVAGGTAGNPGNTSTTFDSTHGCGSGGSGGPASNTAGFAGGNYGGGSGSNGAATGTSPAVAKGGDGLLCITYTANLQTITSTTTPTKTVTTAKTTLQAVTSTTTPTKSLTMVKSLSQALSANAQPGDVSFSATTSASDAASSSGSFSAAGNTGETMFVILYVTGTTSAITMSGFTLVSGASSGSHRWAVYYRVLQAGDTTFSFSTASAGTAFWLLGATYKGVLASNPVDVSGATVDGTVAVNVAYGAVTTTLTHDRSLVAVIRQGPAAAPSDVSGVPSGWASDATMAAGIVRVSFYGKAQAAVGSTGAATVGSNLANTAYFGLQIAIPVIAPATLVKQAGKLVNSSTSALATVDEVFTPGHVTTNQSIDATTSPLATLVRQTGKIISATTTPVVSLARSIATSISAATSAAASLVRQAGKSVAASTAPVATLANQTGKGIAAETAPVASLDRQTAKAVAAATAPIATLIPSGAFAVTLSAASTSIAGLAREIGKNLSVITSPVATLVASAISEAVARIFAARRGIANAVNPHSYSVKITSKRPD